MSHAKLTICLLLLMPLTAHAEEAAAPRDITFDTLKFEIKKGEAFERKMLTPEIEKLVGKKVRIAGFMLPGTQASGITDFVFVRDNMVCTAFGPNTPLYDLMIVKMGDGLTTNFTTKKIVIDGVFDIREEQYPDGTWLAIYHLTAESVSANNVKISANIQPILEGAGK